MWACFALMVTLYSKGCFEDAFSLGQSISPSEPLLLTAVCELIQIILLKEPTESRRKKRDSISRACSVLHVSKAICVCVFMFNSLDSFEGAAEGNLGVKILTSVHVASSQPEE